MKFQFFFNQECLHLPLILLRNFPFPISRKPREDCPLPLSCATYGHSFSQVSSIKKEELILLNKKNDDDYFSGRAKMNILFEIIEKKIIFSVRGEGGGGGCPLSP